MDPSPQLYPIAVLIKDMKSVDKDKRLTALASLPTIAAALGPDRCRSELLPYLEELLDDEEAVLGELARQLGSLGEAVGGKLHAHILFEPLQELAQVEDEVVREAAVRSIVTILTAMDSPVVKDEVMEVGRKLAEADWHTHRVSAAALFAGCLGRLGREAQSEALTAFADLAKDTHTQVRKVVGEQLLKVVKDYPAALETQVLAILSDIAADKEDSIRLLSVQAICLLCETLSPSKRNSLLLPLIRSLADDKAWRVRYCVADQIAKLATSFTPEIQVGVLCPLYVGFLKDGESEVRTAACSRLLDFAGLFSADQVASQLLPCLSALVTDVEVVKAALAGHLTRLCVVVGRVHASESVFKLIVDLLKDESTDIKLCLFKELESLKTVLGADTVAQSILPIIADLAGDKRWRVRLQVLELMPTFAKQLGADFFVAHFQALYLQFVSDGVYSIREALLKGLREVTSVLGANWMEANFLGALLELKEHESYLLRITALQAVTVLCPLLTQEVQRAAFLPLLNYLMHNFKSELTPTHY